MIPILQKRKQASPDGRGHIHMPPPHQTRGRPTELMGHNKLRAPVGRCHLSVRAGPHLEACLPPLSCKRPLLLRILRGLPALLSEGALPAHGHPCLPQLRTVSDGHLGTPGPDRLVLPPSSAPFSLQIKYGLGQTSDASCLGFSKCEMNERLHICPEPKRTAAVSWTFCFSGRKKPVKNQAHLGPLFWRIETLGHCCPCPCEP